MAEKQERYNTVRITMQPGNSLMCWRTTCTVFCPRIWRKKEQEERYNAVRVDHHTIRQISDALEDNIHGVIP